MQVCLITRDDKLREFISEIVGSSIKCSPPGLAPPAADLYLWILSYVKFTQECSVKPLRIESVVPG